MHIPSRGKRGGDRKKKRQLKVRYIILIVDAFPGLFSYRELTAPEMDPRDFFMWVKEARMAVIKREIWDVNSKRLGQASMKIVNPWFLGLRAELLDLESE